MVADSASPATPGAATALYRRFRPGRFSELRGQDHVVRALQGAVKNGRVVHAYLFSGPRGTGKTTTARILAKALNCANPVDGDACDECPSCLAITAGSSLDVTELDAASNNGVDDVREITAGAWHNTPGRWKVYIVDEVHQLSRAASAALLKTLEEPPAHVVFVLATTDPHKVLPTIRSRTQHLEFRLFASETLGALLAEVREAEHVSADDATLEAAVRLGRGSARDALSALDQLVATGSLADSRPTFDDLLGALCDADAVAALTALSRLTGGGWDPEQVAEAFALEVRQVFLLQVAPEVADAIDVDRARLSEWGTRLGLARSVRVLEALGRAMREMRGAPEKVVVLEVALVRLVRPELDHSIDALDERITRLERQGPSPAAPIAPAPSLRPIGSTAPVTAAASQVDAAAPPAPSVAPAVDAAVEASPTPSNATLSVEEVRERFASHVLTRTSRAVQMLLKGARVQALHGSRLTVALPSEEARRSAGDYAPALQRALDHEFKTPFTLEWIVDESLVGAAPPESRRAQRREAPVADATDDADGDEAVVVVDSAGEHLIIEAFPGAEEVS
ncbi:MAG: DNA polymerase III subunit gamma/tau [Acidimicrobiales bacterium]